MDNLKNADERKGFYVKAYLKKKLIEELSLASSTKTIQIN